jgi:hypothetical protein
VRAFAAASPGAPGRPLASWQQVIAGPSQAALRWRVAHGVEQAADRSWLMRLDALVGGAWRPAAPLAADDGSIELKRDQRPLGRLLLRDDAVIWCDLQSACMSAPVPPTALQRLRDELPH